jgi:hypothetical protein
MQCLLTASPRGLSRPPLERLHEPADVRPHNDLIAINLNDFLRLLTRRR